MLTLLAGPGGAATTPANTGVTVSAAPSPYGQVLTIGSGKFAGFSLYFLSSDQPPSYACGTKVVNVGGSKFSCLDEWPPLTTSGLPIAGPGVKAGLLGTVYRPDLKAQQVTYAGHPLYGFDDKPHQFTGENFDEPTLPPWHGVWYLAAAATGHAAPRTATLGTVALSDGSTVLGGVMSTGIGPIAFPVYTDDAPPSACTRACAVLFPPLLSQGGQTVKIASGSGLSAANIGTVKRPNGSTQVTYDGHPLYLYSDEDILYPAGPPFFEGNGNGVVPTTGGPMKLVSP